MAPGVDPACNRNEYHEYFLGGKGNRCGRADNLTIFMCKIVLKSGSLNLIDPAVPIIDVYRN
jgi:hypothetical protein